jgi:hypothetical protein
MTTTQERAAATHDEARWCSACAGTGVVDDWHPTGVGREPRPCHDCDGTGWFNAAGQPADPPRSRRVWHELAGVVAFFAVLALAGWLVDNYWPGAVALIALLSVAAWKACSWTR